MLGVPEEKSVAKDWSLSASRESSIASLYLLLVSLELCRMDRNPAGSKPGWVPRSKLRLLICSIAKPANLNAIYPGVRYAQSIYYGFGCWCVVPWRAQKIVHYPETIRYVEPSSQNVVLSPYASL